MANSWKHNWTIDRPLSSGGQGQTSIVRKNDDASSIAVLKTLRNKKDKHHRARMAREVVSLSTLAPAGANVPHVIEHNTTEYNSHNDELYVIMTYIPGLTLQEYVDKNGPLSLDSSLKFTLSLCPTIEIAHNENVLHRDLKPDNIMVRDADTADLVIVDYGLSFNSLSEDVTRVEETFRNKFLDLPETNTPDGDRRDKRSDTTAVCAILHFCLTGLRPHHLVDSHGLHPHRRVGGQLDRLLTDHRVEAVNRIFTTGFSAHINTRFQSISELTASIHATLSSGRDLPSTPVELSHALAERIQQENRPAQLERFAKESAPLFGHIRKHAIDMAKKIKDFKLQVRDINFAHAKNIHIEGRDSVGSTFLMLLINHPHITSYKCMGLIIASTGRQCIATSVDLSFNSNEQTTNNILNGQSGPQSHLVKGATTDIGIYEHDTSQVLDLILNKLDGWLTDSMLTIYRSQNE